MQRIRTIHGQPYTHGSVCGASSFSTHVVYTLFSQMSTCTHTQTHTRARTHTHTQTNKHTLAHTHVHTQEHKHIHTNTHKHTPTNTHRHTQTHTNTHTHIHTNTHRASCACDKRCSGIWCCQTRPSHWLSNALPLMSGKETRGWETRAATLRCV